LLRIFPQKFTPQERVERCMDAFYELHDGEGPSSTEEEMLRKVRLFVSEADSILAEGREEKDGLAQTLGKHPWFAENGQEVRYDRATNVLSLAVLGAAAVDWDPQEEEEQKEWKPEVKEEPEASWKKPDQRQAATSGWFKDEEDDSAANWYEQSDWNQPRGQDRSRSPPKHWRSGYDYNAGWDEEPADEKVDWGNWDASDAAHPRNVAISKAASFPPAPRASRAVSKAAAIAAGYTGPKAEPGEMENPEARRFSEALMRCLPEDIRPWDSNSSMTDILKACHTARGDAWPKLDLVGGGLGGSSSIADLHELSVSLLNRVREKALAEAVPVEEGTELTTMFVKENRLGTETEAALRSLPVTANLRVIGAGSVTGCDPEAVINARIRRAREASNAPPTLLSPEDVRFFVESNWVSTDAEKALRQCSAEIQRSIVAEGPLLGQMPSNELLERIDQAQNKAIGAVAA